MVIVCGTFTVDADKREAFLTGRMDSMHASRAESGCQEYTFCADPIDPERVVLIERWASQQDLDAHLVAARARTASSGTAVAPRSVSIVIYDVAGERPLGR